MMKRILTTLILCIAIIAGALPSFAADSVTAVRSVQRIYLDGAPVELLAYNIGGYNRVRIRELGMRVNFSVYYDAATNSVRISREYPYIADTEPLPSPGDNETAVPSSQAFYVRGNLINITAYLIAGNNYATLREVCAAINLGLAYDPDTDSVYMDTQTAYLPDMPPELLRPEAIPDRTAPGTTAGADKVLITEKVLDGSEWAREDYSAQANPAIFDSVFTRAAYNTIRQSLIDRDTILADNNENGFNLYYRYANFIDPNYSANGVPGDTYNAMDTVVWMFNGYYQFTLGIEPYVKNRYDYWGYRICKAVAHEFYAPANQATDAFINEVKALESDREKVKRINAYVCDRIYYNASERSGGTNNIFTSATPVAGTCGTYTEAFNYLCQRAGIPCVKIQSETHGWNAVLVDGSWYILDLTANDTAPPDYEVIFLWDTHPDYTDKNPKHTLFAQELLAPSSTVR